MQMYGIYCMQTHSNRGSYMGNRLLETNTSPAFGSGSVYIRYGEIIHAGSSHGLILSLAFKTYIIYFGLSL